MKSDLESIFAVTRADVKCMLIEEQAELSPDDFEDACLYVKIAFENVSIHLIEEGIQDFLYEKQLEEQIDV